MDGVKVWSYFWTMLVLFLFQVLINALAFAITSNRSHLVPKVSILFTYTQVFITFWVMALTQYLVWNNFFFLMSVILFMVIVHAI